MNEFFEAVEASRTEYEKSVLQVPRFLILTTNQMLAENICQNFSAPAKPVKNPCRLPKKIP